MLKFFPKVLISLLPLFALLATATIIPPELAVARDAISSPPSSSPSTSLTLSKSSSSASPASSGNATDTTKYKDYTTTGGSNSTSSGAYRFVAYWSVWSDAGTLPSADQLKGVTHIILSFVDMTDFSAFLTSTNGKFDSSTAGQLRALVPGVKVMASFGGWGLDTPFRPASSSINNQKTFANNVKTFLDTFDLDGADLDWEYPVGNGQNYKLPSTDPNSRPIDYADATNFAELLAEIRSALGSDKLISVPVPSREADMLAYNASTIPAMDVSVDFWNLMTYDYINRRDTKTGYAAGGTVVDSTVKAYTSFGISPKKMNIGFPMYSKWFYLNSTFASGCSEAHPIGCPMGGYEDATGQDTGLSGSWSFDVSQNTANATLQASWQKATSADGTGDSTALSSAWYDETNNWFWTWVSSPDVGTICQKYKSQVGGMMVWSLNEDTNGADGGTQIQALSSCVTL